MDLTSAKPDGLRTRQKSKRRSLILGKASELFETHGYDATTMARIAMAAEVSVPTVFNYFGTKDELIIGLVLEGHMAGREAMGNWRPDPKRTMGDNLAEMMCLYADLTMDIAGKRVWRYAEATNIRRPDSAVVGLYAKIEDNHVSEIAQFLRGYLTRDCAAARQNCDLLARVVYHHWNALFFQYIRDEAQSLATHKVVVRRDLCALAGIVSLEMQDVGTDL